MAVDEMVELNDQDLDTVNGGIQKQVIVDKTKTNFGKQTLKPHTGGPSLTKPQVKKSV